MSWLPSEGVGRSNLKVWIERQNHKQLCLCLWRRLLAIPDSGNSSRRDPRLTIQLDQSTDILSWNIIFGLHGQWEVPSNSRSVGILQAFNPDTDSVQVSKKDELGEDWKAFANSWVPKFATTQASEDIAGRDAKSQSQSGRWLAAGGFS